MKTKISRISRRTVSMVLALLMMVSVLGIGSLITTNAADVSKKATGAGSMSTFPAGMHVYFKLNTSKWNNPSTVYAFFFTTTGWSNTSGQYTSVSSTKNDDGYFSATVPNDGKTYKRVQFRSANNVSGGNYTNVHAPDYVWNNTVYDNNSGNWNDFTSWGSYSTKKTNSQGKIYFDNSQTQWTGNIYLVVARATDSWYFRADKMTADSDAPDIYYYSMSSTFSDGYTAIGFANSGNSTITSGNDGSTFYNNASKKTTWINGYAINNSNSTYVGTPTTSGSDVGYSLDYQSTSYNYFDKTYTLYSGAHGSAKIDGYQFSAHGSATANDQATASASGNTTMTIAKSSTVTVTPVPATGYQVKSVTLDSTTGTALTDEGDGTYTYKADGTAHSIYVEFEPATYSITYKDGGGGNFSGTHGSNHPTTHTYGTATTLVNPSKSGYRFGGWYTDSTCTTSAGNTLGATAYTSNITLYAKWIQLYGVTTVNGSYGTLSASPTSLASGETVTLTAAVTNSAYKFNGVDITRTSNGAAVTTISASSFSNTVLGGTYSYTMPAYAVTATAKYTQKTYTITLSETGGSGGTMQVDSAAFTSGSTVTHGSHTFRVDAPSGKLIDTISGIGTWTKSGDETYATLGSTSITSAQTITVTYKVAGRPSLDTIADVSKDANTTTFNVTATINDEDKKTSTLTATASSGTTSVATVGSPTVSGSTVTIPVTIKGVVGSSTITVNLLDGSSTVSTQTFTVSMTEPTFTIGAKAIYVNDSAVNGGAITNGGVTPSSITYSSNNTTYITVNATNGKLTAAKVPSGSDQTATISATAHYASGYEKPASYTATLKAPSLSASSSAASGYVGGSATGSCSGSNPSLSSDSVASYSWASNNTNVVAVTNETTATPSFSFKKAGSATITLTVTYKNTSLTKTASVNITVNPPTVAFNSNSPVALNVGGSNTNTATGSNPSGGSIEYSGTNQYISVNASTGAVTGLKPTSDPQTVTATYTVTNSGQTSTASTSYNVTVKTPTISADNLTVAVGAHKTIDVSTTNVDSPTFTYTSNDTSVATVNEDGRVVGVAAGTATITVSGSKQSWSGSDTATVTVEAPELTIDDEDLDGDTVYATVGTDNTYDLANNFEGGYTVTSSNDSVAEASESSGTLTIHPVAKGTATITVTASKSYTRATVDISKAQTFTVNVAEADNSQFITLATSWSSAYIYYWGSSPANANKHLQMTKVGTDNEGRNVYAINVGTDTFSKINAIIFESNNNWADQTNDITGQQSNSAEKNKLKNTSGTKFNSFYIDGSTNNKNDAGGYNTTITIPQITTPSTLEVAVDDTETITPTVVNNVTPAATLFESDDTDTANVGASTGVVTGVDAGSANVTAYAFAPKPHSEWLSWITDSTTKNIIAGSATTSVSVTDTPRTINFSNTLKTTSGGNYDAANANLAGTVSASYTTGGSGSGSGSGTGTTGDYYALYNKGGNYPDNWSGNANTGTEDMYKNSDGSYTAVISNDTTGHNTYVLLKTDSNFNSSNQVFTQDNDVYAAVRTNGIWDSSTINDPNNQVNGSYHMFYYSLKSNQTVYVTYYPAAANNGTRCIKLATTKPAYADGLPGSGGSGGSGGDPVVTPVTDGSTVPNGTAVTFTVDSVSAGYRFVGWEENGTVVETATTYTKSGVRANYTVHARFEKGVEVTFKDYNDNVLKSATFTFDGEVPATPADDPTRTGYTFNGWSSDGGTTTYTTALIPAVSGTSAIVYTAQYSVVVYQTTGKILVSNNGTSYSDVSTYDNDHKISVSTADGGATFTIKNTNDTDISNPASMAHPASVKLVATAVSGYELVGIYRVRSDMSEEEVSCSTSADNSTKTCSNYSFTTENEPGYNFVAKFKKIHYITLYNTYEEEAGNNFKFVSPPPRQVKVGTGGSAITYTYAAGTAEQRGEDIIATATGTSGTYYEGNRIPVPAGTEVKLTYSALASSDAISGVFFNNGIRYTHELEDDNLYKNRVEYTGASDDKWGNEGDDNFGTSINPYTYLPATTLYADASFYSGATATTISGQTYTAAVNNTDHTVTWTAVDDYLNIDLELATKYRIIINNDEWNGIEVTNSTYNAEGYYFPGERINGDDGIEVSLDTSDSSKHFSFTDVNTIQKKTGDNTYETVTDVELVKSDGKYYIRGTDADNKDMPAYDIYVGIGVKEEYNLKLGNVVVSDEIGNKTMLNQTGVYDQTDGATAESSASGHIGTVTAIVSDGNDTDIAYENNSTYHWYYDGALGGSAGIYENNSESHNFYLKRGGVNKTGSMVEAGQTVTYTFNFASGKDAEYSFVGWFEGKLENDLFVPDYTKKLSGKTTFTYTPKKDTVVIAAGTRDMYLGGNFTSAGAYTTTAASQTWASGRIKMEFDPTYVNPEDSSKKGRYFYKFETVTANTEYQFRAYDTISGTDKTNLDVWKTWSGEDYAKDNDDVFYGRHKYADADGASHGQFVYKTNTNNWSLIDNTASDHDSNKNHQANGYAAPVTVYFYAYDGGIGVESEYQWSKAYVSAGRGIDCTNYSSVIGSGASPTYNTPTVSVANKTVNDKDVDGTTTPVSYGDESVYKCTVKEKDGQITVSACPGVTDLELDAFVVYNIDTKESEAVKHSSTTGTGAATAYVAEITVPQNSSVYIVPVYKFTDAYITDTGLKAHTVYVRTDDIDKDVWGGLVAMYSWGSKTDSGGWPGQLLVPSDDGKSFYGQLAFGAGDLRGITFNNYCSIYDHNQKTFVGTYGSDVSTTAYSGNSTHVYQTYDYREPISIIENIADKIYEDEDMDLTFALKSGDMTAAPTIDSLGSGAYNRASTWEYLTDRSGKKRVDLNGNALATNSTETYRIVAYYTKAYKNSGSYDFEDGSRDGTGYSGEYSINWTVYDATGASTGVSGVLSAAYTDVFKSEGMTYIASKLIDAGYPVSGKAVKIAYENPGTWSETIRYSGQWYADGINTLIEAKTRVGIYSDGAWLPSDTNAPGYGTATIACPTMNAGKGENLVQEFSSGNSLAKVIKSRGTNGEVQFTVDSTDNFLGWYREDGEGGFEPVGSNYKNQTITPSFNDDITYYAFYSASASYVFEYTSRDGSKKQYTAKGSDLTDAELAAGGTLNASARTADITSKLSGINQIKVFNRTFTYDISSADTSKPYVIKYSDPGTENTYDVDVYDAPNSKIGTVSSTFGNPIDLYRTALTGKPANTNIDLGSGDNVFIGWKKYDTTESKAVGDYLSTQPNFGYSVTEDTSIIACYGSESDKETARADLWRSYIDKNVITQELTSETTGKLYNDSIIAFRNGVGTNTPLPLDGTKECGIVILAQTNGATTEEQSQFDTRGQNSLLGYANNFRQTGTTSGKMSSKYGEAYAFCIKAESESLSALNRVDLCQILDYAKFGGGKYKVMSYYYDASVDGTGGYKCSEVVNGTYTVS